MRGFLLAARFALNGVSMITIAGFNNHSPCGVLRKGIFIELFLFGTYIALRCFDNLKYLYFYYGKIVAVVMMSAYI